MTTLEIKLWHGKPVHSFWANFYARITQMYILSINEVEHGSFSTLDEALTAAIKLADSEGSFSVFCGSPDGTQYELIDDNGWGWEEVQ